MNQQHPGPASCAGRRGLVWVRRPELIALLLIVFLPPVLAWVDFLAFGLPATAGDADPANPWGPHQFPIWLRGWHYLNLVLAVLLAGTGWRIGRDRPQLRWREDGADWATFGPDRQDDDLDRTRGRHAWLAAGWLAAGWIYLGLAALTGEAEHVAPLTWRTIPEAWHVFVQYATFHLPLDPESYYRYNSLQLLSYTTVMFGFVPTIALTGLAITPAFGGRGRGLARIFGNREAARSVHYLAILAYVAFIATHVTFVVMYACWLDLDHVVLGADETGLPGGVIAAVGIGGIALVVWLTRWGRRRGD